MQSVILTIPAGANRLQTITEEYPAELPSPIIWNGIPPEELTPPDWWCGSSACWSNSLNMRNIMAWAAEQGEPVFVFEDDNGFAPDFYAKFTEFMDAVPSDWQQILPCAWHRHFRIYAPVQINDKVLRVRYGVTTNAILVKPTAARMLADALSESNWNCSHVPDNKTALLQDKKLITYAPFGNICCQRAGASLIWGNNSPQDRWFNNFTYITPDGNTKRYIP